MKKYLLLLLVFSATMNTVNAEENSLLQQAIDGKHRSAQNKSRDQYRHPLETLNFFDVKPNMSVVEIWPGGKGWYTEILAPYLKENGTFYAAQFSSESKNPYFTRNLQRFNSKIGAQSAIYGNVIVTVLQPPQFINIAPNNSVDRVLTFRNVHNWMKNDQTDVVFSAMYDALKIGGILGVVEHRADENSKQDPKALSAYVKESVVIAFAEKAGFTLIEKSEINANPKDTKDYPKGVWSLPPSLKLKEQDKAKYIAIGESDRMTLKFIKK